MIDNQTKKKTVEPNVIKDNNISVTLYDRGHTLSTLANEFGDVVFGVENPRAVYEDRKLPEQDQRSSQFSRAYQSYILGKRESRPNAKNVKDY